MDRTSHNLRRIGLMLALAVAGSCGCQTVKTPEERIAKSNIPKEFTKANMPDYVVEPPDLARSVDNRSPRSSFRAACRSIRPASRSATRSRVRS